MYGSLCLGRAWTSIAHIQQQVLTFIEIYHASDMKESDAIYNNTLPNQDHFPAIHPLHALITSSLSCFDFPPFLTHNLVLSSSFIIILLFTVTYSGLFFSE